MVKHQGNWFSQWYNLELAGNKRCCVSASRQLVSSNVDSFYIFIHSEGWPSIEFCANGFEFKIKKFLQTITCQYILIDKEKKKERLYKCFFFFAKVPIFLQLSRLIIMYWLIQQDRVFFSTISNWHSISNKDSFLRLILQPLIIIR